MALTIYQQPQVLTPAYNSQVITALSDKIAVTDFKYVVTVEVNSSGEIYTEDILQSPDGYFIFDPQEWVKNYIEHYFNPAISLVNPIEIAKNKSVAVEVKITEFYTAALHPLDTITVNFTAFDACLINKDFNSYNFNDYIFGGSANKYFLSKNISTITPDARIVGNQDLWIHFIQNSLIPFDNITIIQTRSALFGGGVIFTVVIETITIGTIPTGTIANEMYVLNVGTNCLASPLVGDTVTVSFNNGIVSQLDYSYNITNICTRFTDLPVYYLDRDGNVLCFHFEMMSKNSANIKTNKVILSSDNLNTSTGAYGHNSWDRESHIVSTLEENTLSIATNWITEIQSEQLKELWSSPQRWIVIDGDYIPFTIPDAPYESKLFDNESLFNYSCIIDLSKETRQRGL